jgi:short-subunit dehydrogenase
MVSAASITARRILVTGANRGLGFATALELARRGHELILTARRLEDVDSLKRRMLAQIPHRTVGVHSLDLASFDSIRRFAVSIVSRKAPIQTVLHNAGLVLPPPQRHVTEDGIEESLAVAAVGAVAFELEPASCTRPSVTTCRGELSTSCSAHLRRRGLVSVRRPANGVRVHCDARI